ncbi:acetolactate synthase large subunit [Mycobacterium sp.]|uniref:acetolactate synthase large subunit n=1 Tax=Mycobacterium sp. TaxID=1785 RepID=UPI0012851883|nr:acetolactate synthase large subunit [Mycobacterium sp.]KAA8961789.1 MAG: acetolactate synthase large subunit [Mycobacterium sp.]
MSTAAELIVQCLENEGVSVVFGLPGEENIRLMQALAASNIRYVLTRHEQAAAFMAEMYGRVTGRASVVSATLGPGAINMQLGVADATTNSTPLVAISAQVGQDRQYKESHQSVDLVALFTPITRWADGVPTARAIPEMVRKAFKLAETERPAAVYLAIPEHLDADTTDYSGVAPLPRNVVRAEAPAAGQVARAAAILRAARRPVVLAGHGAARNDAGAALVRFAEALGTPVANTFHGKGVVPDDHPASMGTIGFMRRDYVNFGFDAADVVVAVGYELQEFDPVQINPRADKKIIHIHRFPAEVDAHYSVDVGIEGDISAALDALADALAGHRFDGQTVPGRPLLNEELARGQQDSRFPMAPARVVADTRAAMGRNDVVLVDTGAAKMWMARLYPAYERNTCLFSNGLSTMAFALPGALGVKLARPEAKVLAVVGDGAFLMNSQEIETAVREQIPLVVLIWEDGGYGLIEWKMDLELGDHYYVRFTNPDVVSYAASFGATGYRIGSADELLPTLRAALDDDGVSLISCPVDYAENLRLTERLGQLDDTW